jgi:tripartite-type tricarboxylate transporter receptor subunit TctC
MESMLEQLYKSAAWRQFAEKNMYENIWLGSADYAKHLKERQVLVTEFLTAIGIAKKK